jgi:hypothetical protein
MAGVLAVAQLGVEISPETASNSRLFDRASNYMTEA